MSRLFISLYLDEDVSVIIAKLLTARAYSAMTTQQSNRCGRSDAEQLAFAVERGMAILSHNRADFAKLDHQYLAAGKKHHGIIIAARRSPYEITRRLLAILDRISAEDMDNQVLYI